MEQATQAMSKSRLSDIEASLKAFVQDNISEEKFEFPGTDATIRAAFSTLRRWILEAQAADKAHTTALLDQANLLRSDSAITT